MFGFVDRRVSAIHHGAVDGHAGVVDFESAAIGAVGANSTNFINVLLEFSHLFRQRQNRFVRTFFAHIANRILRKSRFADVAAFGDEIFDDHALATPTKTRMKIPFRHLVEPFDDVDAVGDQRQTSVERRPDDFGDVITRVGSKSRRIRNDFLGRSHRSDQSVSGFAVHDNVRDAFAGSRNGSSIGADEASGQLQRRNCGSLTIAGDTSKLPEIATNVLKITIETRQWSVVYMLQQLLLHDFVGSCIPSKHGSTKIATCLEKKTSPAT